MKDFNVLHETTKCIGHWQMAYHGGLLPFSSGICNNDYVRLDVIKHLYFITSPKLECLSLASLSGLV
jgi:hypothetical protein